MLNPFHILRRLWHLFLLGLVLLAIIFACLFITATKVTTHAVTTPKPVPIITVTPTPKPTPIPTPTPTPTPVVPKPSPTPTPTPKPTPTPPKVIVDPGGPTLISESSGGDAAYYGPGYPAKTAALTFDDGPGPSTASIIAILQKYGVPATFFNIGDQMADYPSAIQAEAADGFTLGDHTWDHVDLVPLTLAQQQYEINRVIQEYQTLTGKSPTVFRPPNGDYNTYTEEICTADHMAIDEWTIDPADWQYAGTYSQADVNAIVHAVESQITSDPGDVNPIILLHNPLAGTPDTVAALPTIIQWLQANGFKLVALS